MSYFEPADEELLELAREVIEQSHPHLRAARFGFAFRNEAGTRHGFQVLASVSVVSPLQKVHLNFDYLIWVAFPDWTIMSAEKRVALLDHEFCHCRPKDNGEWGICDHDVQEFLAVIKRHGLWRYDLQRLGKVIQDHLPGLDATAPEGEGAIMAAPAGLFPGQG